MSVNFAGLKYPAGRLLSTLCPPAVCRSPKATSVRAAAVRNICHPLLTSRYSSLFVLRRFSSRPPSSDLGPSLPAGSCSDPTGRSHRKLFGFTPAPVLAPARSAMEGVRKKERSKMTCILSIDGGGIRGVIPAVILLFFEKELQKLDGPDVRISDYFDVITGTSTGGIIGGILTAPNEQGRPQYDAEDIMSFYTKEGPKIFARRSFPIITQLTGPKHDASVLERVLKDNLKDLKMKDTLCELLIPTYDIKHMQPTYFTTSEARRNELKNAYVRDVLRGTSAAPTYFSPKVFSTFSSDGRTQEFNLVDGGVGINNPAHLSIAHTILGELIMKQGEAINIEDYRSLLVLSLGTGKVVQSYDGKKAAKWGVLSWVLSGGQVPILNIVSECNADVVDYNLSTFYSVLHRPDNYLRIQAFNISPEVKSLDNIKSDNIQKLREVGESLLDMPVSNVNIETGDTYVERGSGTNREALTRFAERLSIEYRSRRALKDKMDNLHK